ncbi:hypothetical protein RclHR1_00060036 [Rhizophagus clarus]|uniref:Uncharacterized protein n=1 Tax=Rhizophagus clarus TaxID=94130 RepID=A0A2Z6RVZ3_9GLOM|nr:hypothetical protein RclHR1_00060036 [Rhizophagus clarus]GES82176.1 hypothetical protein GLOIN_2v1482262 [Rhizophagus clarus]
MKYEINNVTTQLGLYGSCVHDSINQNFELQNLASIFTCTKGGLIDDFGNAGTKFLGAMHPIALIISLALVILGIISICSSSEDGCIQKFFAIISIIGSIVILLAIIGDILAFNDDSSQQNQFQQNINNFAGGVVNNKSFGPGFGFAIAALVFMLFTICLSCRSRNLTVKVKVKQTGCCCC